MLTLRVEMLEYNFNVVFCLGWCEKHMIISVIDVSTFQKTDSDTLYQNFPVGALSKCVLYQDGTWYLFKSVAQRKDKPDEEPILYYHQIWSEVLAYHLGLSFGLPMAETCVGFGHPEVKFTCGVLSSWFKKPKEAWITGHIFLTDLIDEYDAEKGKKHYLDVILEHTQRIPASFEYWLKLCLFDTLIANQDRHHENWELIRDTKLSPLYDLGSSFAFDHRGSLSQYNHEQQFKRFKAKLRLSTQPDVWLKLPEMLYFFKEYNIRAYTQIGTQFFDAYDPTFVMCLLDNALTIKHIPSEYHLSDERATFIGRFLEKRFLALYTAFKETL